MKTEAWVLHRGPDVPEPGSLELEMIELPEVGDGDVLVEPLFGSWEGNMSHAVERSPIDICQFRNEDSVVIGNSGVVRVLDAGEAVDNVKVGDACLFLGAGTMDPYGYLLTVHGYDAAGTIGLLAKQTVMAATNLVTIPDDTQHSLDQWSAFSVRYVTAWSNWAVAYRCLRAQMPEEDLPHPHVWGWGGGCTLAELDLARRHGCQVTMVSGSDRNLAYIRELGIDAIDRRCFPGLAPDKQPGKNTHSDRRASEESFAEEVRSRTEGEGVSIFVDYLGSPLARLSLKCLARQGVITTAGWKTGMMIPVNRAVECISRHIHVHTHGSRNSEVIPAMKYAEREGWLPPKHEAHEIYDFESIPDLMRDFDAGRTDYFPVYRVNEV